MTKKDPQFINTFFTLANIYFIEENYKEMESTIQKTIAIDKNNALAYYLLAKANKGQGDNIMAIAHLTEAIKQKDNYTEALLMRTELLLQMKQYKEAAEDIDTILKKDAEDESALILRGKLKESTGQEK
ncbi:MAG: tetratricopeptide repeat protein, partial [Bacteroidaceae bacterium]